jgi:hypothetical protein
LEVDFEKGLGHGLGGSIWVDPNKKNQSNLILTKKRFF